MSGIIAQNTLDNSGLIKSPAGGGAWNFIKKLTASASGDLSFVDGTSDVVLDSTYREYFFTFNNIHPSNDNVKLTFNMSIDSGSNYNVTKTASFAQTYHPEAGGAASVEYDNSADITQGTGGANLSNAQGNDADQSISGHMYLFDPSSTTFVKHFITRSNTTFYADYAFNVFVGGYGNTTSAVDAVQFKFSGGDIDSGDICLYGLTT